MVTLQQLRYFREVAKNGHLTRTAENLYITQTTLSNTIIKLERELGVKLFEHVGRNLRLSEVGEQYYRYVNEALIALDNAQAVIADRKEDDQQSVSVAMTSSNIWSDLIYHFRAQHSGYSIRQIGCEDTLFRSMLINQEIDFVITGLDDLPLSGLKYRILREENLYLCVAKEHPLAQKEGVLLADTTQDAFISLPRNSGFRRFCDRLFERAGLPRNIAMECDYTLRGKLVEAGFSVAITTHSFYSKQMLGSDIVYIPILDEFARRPIALVWNPNHYLGRAAVDFRNYVISTIT
jgi:DNA-binding transcriptional LysR family regulator